MSHEKEPRLIIPALYEPPRASNLPWALAIANNERWNREQGRVPRPVAKVYEVLHVWHDGGVFGATYSCLDQKGQELFKVGRRADGIVLCWECNAAACCGHVMEALAYWHGQNGIEGD